MVFFLAALMNNFGGRSMAFFFAARKNTMEEYRGTVERIGGRSMVFFPAALINAEEQLST
jgi:hypothetical protein